MSRVCVGLEEGPGSDTGYGPYKWKGKGVSGPSQICATGKVSLPHGGEGVSHGSHGTVVEGLSQTGGP